MTTTIKSNGSKWYGEENDSIAALIEVMAAHRIELNEYFGVSDCGNGVLSFFGNFETISHAFSIESDDPKVTAPLLAAMRANMGEAFPPIHCAWCDKPRIGEGHGDRMYTCPE